MGFERAAMSLGIAGDVEMRQMIGASHVVDEGTSALSPMMRQESGPVAAVVTPAKDSWQFVLCDLQGRPGPFIFR